MLDRAAVTGNREALLRQMRMVYDDGDLPEGWPGRIGLLADMLEDEGAVDAAALVRGEEDHEAAAAERRVRKALLRRDIPGATAEARNMLAAIPPEWLDRAETRESLHTTVAAVLGLNGEREAARAFLAEGTAPAERNDWRTPLVKLLAEGDVAAAQESVFHLRTRIPCPVPDLPAAFLCAMGLPEWVVPAGEAALCGP